MSEVWRWWPSCPLLHKKGSRQKKSRWFSWATEMAEVAPFFGVLLLVVLRLAIENKWFKSLQGTPLLSDAAPSNVDDDPNPEGGDLPSRHAAASSSQVPPSVQSAEADMQKKRKETSAPKLAASMLCMRTHTSMMLAILRLGQPGHDAHNERVTECKTQLGSVHWLVGRCTGGWQQTAKHLAAKLGDPKVLREVGLFLPSSRQQQGAAAYQDELRRVESMFALTCEFLRAEVNEGRMLSEFAPYAAVALLSHDQAKRTEALGYFKKASQSFITISSERPRPSGGLRAYSTFQARICFPLISRSSRFSEIGNCGSSPFLAYLVPLGFDHTHGFRGARGKLSSKGGLDE